MTHPVRMSTGLITHAENLVVSLTGDGGRQGWGEAAAAPPMTGETLDGMFAAACHLSPYLLARPWPDIRSAAIELERRMPHNYAVKAAFDIALHDMLGKITGQSVSDLLGGARRRRIDTLALIGAGTLATDAAAAVRAVNAGYRALKLKVGTLTVEEDAARAIAVRAAIGDGILLCADANGAWSASQADRFLALASGARLAYLEQPVAPEDIAAMAGSFQRHGIPIGLDESLRSFEDLRRACEADIAQGGSFKLIKIGGLAQLVKAVADAHQHGYGINIAGKVAETGISTAALLHAAAAGPALPWGCSPSNGYLQEDIIEPGIVIADGSVPVPTGPGLGISVNLDRLAARTDASRIFTGADAAA